MRRITLCAIALMALLVAGCSIPRPGGMGGNDPVAQHIDMMKTSPMVMYFVNFHKNPEVGQWAKIKSAMGEEWYGIVGGKKGAWLVEKRSTPMGQQFELAILMEVDDKGAVKKAWAAEYKADAEEKPEGVEVAVMAKPEAQPAATGGKAAEGPKPKWSKEEVAGLKCDKMTVGDSEMWFSPKAYFTWMLDTPTPMEKGGTVKMAYAGTVNSELLEQGKAELAPSMTMPAAE